MTITLPCFFASTERGCRVVAEVKTVVWRTANLFTTDNNHVCLLYDDNVPFFFPTGLATWPLIERSQKHHNVSTSWVSSRGRAVKDHLSTLAGAMTQKRKQFIDCKKNAMDRTDWSTDQLTDRWIGWWRECSTQLENATCQHYEQQSLCFQGLVNQRVFATYLTRSRSTPCTYHFFFMRLSIFFLFRPPLKALRSLGNNQLLGTIPPSISPSKMCLSR